MKTLRQGDSGPQVQLLQLALGRAGYPPRGGRDGVFGSGTLASVRAFQSAYGLTPDGVVGPRTWGALEPWLLGYTVATVRPGDTMYRLAQRYGTGVTAIVTANPSANPLNLQIGSRLIIPYSFDVVPVDIAFTSTVLGYCVRGLSARYPSIRRGTVGTSVIGVNIPYLYAGRGDNQLFLNASHHANEWITSVFAMKFFENYMKAVTYKTDIGGKSASRLYSATTFICLPMVNPDGVDLVTGELDETSIYYINAKNMNTPPVPFPSGWKANIQGIDLNLQYPAGWEEARRIKFAQGYTRPGPRDYVGSAPLVAPESLAVYNFTLSSNFLLTLSYHTVGEVIYWKYDGFEPVNSRKYGQVFADVSGYALELTPTASGYAGYKDWFIQNYNRPGYTVEAGTGASPVPLYQFPKILRDNTPLVASALEIVGSM